MNSCPSDVRTLSKSRLVSICRMHERSIARRSDRVSERLEGFKTIVHGDRTQLISDGRRCGKFHLIFQSGNSVTIDCLIRI
jgi:hypothetical protein